MNIYGIHATERLLAVFSSLGIDRQKIKGLKLDKEVNEEFYKKRVLRGINHFNNFYNQLPGKDCFLEFGTGASCVDLILAHLVGFEKIITCDINDHVSTKYLRKTNLFEEYLPQIATKFNLDKNLLSEKLIRIKNVQNKNDFFEKLNIHFLRFEELEPDIANNVDIWYSISNLQRIPLETIKKYSKIAVSNLKEDGITYHKVDCSDIHSQSHYPFSSDKIHKLDYLQHSECVWNILNNNKYGCQNRIRYPQYLKLLEGLGMYPNLLELYVDQSDINYIRNLQLSDSFKYMSNKQIAVTHFKIRLTKSKKECNYNNKKYFSTSELDPM